MAMARETFLNAGGFNERFELAAAEDRELCDRWAHSGRRIVYTETALVHHSHGLTLRSFWQQHFQYGGGAQQYRRARAERDAGRVRVEPLSFYTGLLRYPWTARVRWPLRVAALLFLAQAANAMGFFRAALSGSDGRPGPDTVGLR
jgi:GT2 family glycosyltransferase